MGLHSTWRLGASVALAGDLGQGSRTDDIPSFEPGDDACCPEPTKYYDGMTHSAQSLAGPDVD